MEKDTAKYITKEFKESEIYNLIPGNSYRIAVDKCVIECVADTPTSLIVEEGVTFPIHRHKRDELLDLVILEPLIDNGSISMIGRLKAKICKRFSLDSLDMAYVFTGKSIISSDIWKPVSR